MNVARELLPAGLGLAAAAAVVYVALDRGWGAGPWLLALLLLGHGAVHAMFLLPAPAEDERKAGSAPYPFTMDDSWLLGRMGVDGSRLRLVGAVLVVLTLVAFLLAALATVGWAVPGAWWGPLVVGAAVLSSLLLLVFLSPLLVLGFALNAALVWLVVASVGAPGA